MKGGRDRPLTDKEEIFLQELIKGKSQREAYRTAYYNSKMKDNSVDVAASKLLKKDNVLLRYMELKEEAKERTLWSYEKAQNTLMEFLEMCKTDKDKKHALGYIKELNSLSGLYEEKKETAPVTVRLIKHE